MALPPEAITCQTQSTKGLVSLLLVVFISMFFFVVNFLLILSEKRALFNLFGLFRFFTRIPHYVLKYPYHPYL